MMASLVSKSGSCRSAVSPPFEAREESLLKSFQITWWAIARHNDLLSRLMKLIENIKENFLGLFAASQKLNVIQDQ